MKRKSISYYFNPLLLILLFFAVSSAQEISELEDAYSKELYIQSLNPPAPNVPVEVIRDVGATDEADVTVTIGTGTTLGSYPIYDYWWNVASASLYTAAEIGTGPGTITHLRWYCGNVASGWGARRVYIYLKHTTDTQISAVSYTAMIAGATLVYDSGAENYTGPTTIGWNEWDINDFAYDGSSNLYVIVYSYRPAYSSSTTHWYYHTATNMHWYKQADSSWDPSTAGTLSANRPNIQMEITTSPTAPAPPILVYPPNGAIGVPPNAVLSWSVGANTHNWDVYFSTNQADVQNLSPAALVAAASTSTTYDPPGNMAEAIYYWRVVTRNASTLETTNGPVWTFNTYQPLTGVKTIGGTNPDFATFTQAINVLQLVGVGTGGVIFNVRPGTYPERFTVPPIPNASASNPIIFQRESGTVTVNGTGTTSTTEAMITLQGCDYVTFDGINVQDGGTSSANYVERGYFITNASATDGAWYNTIKNCTINMTRANTSSRGIYQNPTTAPTAASGSNSYNTWENIKIGNCATYAGYFYGGTSYYDVGTVVRSSTSNVNDPNRFVVGYNGPGDIGGLVTTYGLYFGYQQDLTVENIDITGIQAGGASTSTYSAYGLYLATNYGTINIRGNRIFGITAFTQSTSSSGYVYGMYLSPGTTPTVNVYNNFIYNLNIVTSYTTNTTTRYLFGIYFLSGIFNIYHNSVVVGHPTNYLNLSNAAIFQSSGTADFRNNIVFNRTGNQTTAQHFGYYRSSGTYTGNNNCFYIPNPTNGFVGYFNANQATLGNWQTASGQDASSFTADPIFVDPASDLHVVIGSNSPVNNAGQPIAMVTTDIDGETRNANNPDIGADEGDFALAGAPEIPTLIYPANGANGIPVNAVLQWANGANTANVDIYFSTNQTHVQTMNPAALVASMYTQQSYDPPGDLTLYTYYYWRLVARNAEGTLTTPGPVWSFNTFVPLTGIATIGGTNPTFNTFTDALNVLSVAGVGAGGVIFNVRPGNYPERITVLPIPNASATNPVIFQRESGPVTLNGVGTSGTTDAMVTLQGCDYVTFDGINVQDGGTSSADYVERGYWITNNSATDGAWYNTIKNCTINMTRANTSSRGIYQSINVTPTNANGANSYNTWENIKIGNVATYAGYLYGNSTYRDIGTVIRSSSPNVNAPNRFVIGYNGPGDIGGLTTVYGLYLVYQEDFIIENIDVCNLLAGTSSSTYSVYGIYTSSVYGNNTIRGCRVFDLEASTTSTTSSGYVYGLYSSAISTATMNIYNNFFYNYRNVTSYGTNTLTRYQFGMYLLTAIFNVYNNSFLVGDPTVGVNLSNAAVYQSSGTVNFLNNIVYNRTGNQIGAEHYGYYRASGTYTGDRNIFYLPNTSGAYVGYLNTAYATLSSWQAGTLQDANSFDTNPRYVDDSTTDLHIQVGVYTPVNNNASVLAIVTTDIDGEPRSPTTPDIGADEGDFIADPNSPSNMTLTNITSSSMTVNWQDNSTTESGFNLYYSTNGINWTLIPLGPNVTTYNATGLNVNTQYWWRVFAVIGGNETVGYAEANAWTLTLAPGLVSLTLTGTGYSTAQITSIDPGSNPLNANYRVFCVTTNNWVTAAGTLGTPPRTASAAGWTNFNLTGLPRGTTLVFYAVSVNGGGVNGPNGPTSQITTNDYPNSGGPDGGGYYFRTSAHPAGPTYNWIDHSTHTVLSALTSDDQTVPLSIAPFTFPFYGTNYTQLQVCSNGHIEFGATGSTSYTNGVIPTTTFSYPAIFPLWDDLNPYGAPYVYYNNMGDGRYVITYFQARKHAQTTADTATFQIVLYSDGRILFQYRFVQNTFNASIGIQANSTVGTMYGEVDIYPNPNWAIMFYPFPPTQPTIAVNPTTAAFGSVMVGNNGQVQITVSNTGTANLQITNITTPTNVSADWTTATITPGNSQPLTLTWTPLASGTLSGNITISSNDPANPTLNIPVTGWAYVAPSTPTNVTVTYSGGSATISWNASTGNVTGYNIYVNTSSGYFNPTPERLLVTLPAGTLSYVHSGVTGVRYYRVTAYYDVPSASATQSDIRVVTNRDNLNVDRNVQKSMFSTSDEPKK